MGQHKRMLGNFLKVGRLDLMLDKFPLARVSLTKFFCKKSSTMIYGDFGACNNRSVYHHFFLDITFQ